MTKDESARFSMFRKLRAPVGHSIRLLKNIPRKFRPEQIGTRWTGKRCFIPPASLPKPRASRRIGFMAITLDEIVDEAAQLPEDVVAELIERIVVSRHGGIEPGVEVAWKAETNRRVAEIMSGEVEGVPLEESLARASRFLRP